MLFSLQIKLKLPPTTAVAFARPIAIDKDIAIDILTCVTLTISFSDFFSFSLKFSFLQVTVTPFSPKISCFSRVYTSFPQITQKILICRHLPLTGTDHCNSRLLKIITDFRTSYIFFSKFKVAIFKSNIGWIAC